LSWPELSSPGPEPTFARALDPLTPEVGRSLARALIDRLPEFVPAYLAMVEACDDDPGEPAVLGELADFVAGRIAVLDTDRHLLERALAVVEDHLVSGSGPGGTAGADEIDELVTLAFFDSFSPEDRRHLVPWLGPRSLAALESLDAPRP
jgi:hypothetical protein